MTRANDDQAAGAQLGAQGVPMTSDAPARGGAATGGREAASPTSVSEGRPNTKPVASGSGVSLVQSGWKVMTSDGDVLGRVSEVAADHLVVQRVGPTTPGRSIVPRNLISSEDEATMRVTLSIDRATADGQFAAGDG